MKAAGLASASTSLDAINERAAALFERRRFGRWSDANEAEFDAWIAESTFHRVAYLRLEAAAAQTEDLFALRPPQPASTESQRNDKVNYRRFVVPLLAAASIALFAALGIPFVGSLMQPPDRTYSTEVGGRTLLKFADGTVVDLDTDTAARFRMTNGERIVWLEKGQAWFHVAHDPANPFTVVVGKHRVTDLGTEFLVHRNVDGMEVALLNGKASLSTEGAAMAMLAPGDDAVATPVSVSVTRKTPQELADELAWRRGVLVFRKTRLAEVVQEFNRYNRTKLVIADPAIAGVRITAEIKTDHFDDLLALMRTVLNLRTDREGDTILISREPREKTRRAARIQHG